MAAAGDFNMDWSNPLALFGMAAEPVDDDDNDDFYEPGTGIIEQKPSPAPAPAPPAQQTLPQSLSAEVKAENQRRAELLRAKLLAQRQNTPSKAVSRSNTPNKMQKPSTETSSKPPASSVLPTVAVQKPKVVESLQNVDGLEALLAEGKAMADAKTAALATVGGKKSDFDALHTLNSNTQINGDSGAREKTTKQEQVVQSPIDARAQPAKQPVEPPHHPTNLSDAYYADLPAWLEITGYHDADYRNSKLRTYKERKTLEQEAARIAERLEKLRQAEQETMHLMRMATPRQTPNMAPPPLPVILPAEQQPQTNGVKRAHSPDSAPAQKGRRREDTNGGFRIRGANDSPEFRPATTRHRPFTPSPPDLERRISYPAARKRNSVDEHKPRSRDPSLERRQNYYRRDAGPPGGYDHYTPRDAQRTGYSDADRSNQYSRPQYRGGTGLDPRKGGQTSRPA